MENSYLIRGMLSKKFPLQTLGKIICIFIYLFIHSFIHSFIHVIRFFIFYKIVQYLLFVILCTSSLLWTNQMRTHTNEFLELMTLLFSCKIDLGYCVTKQNASAVLRNLASFHIKARGFSLWNVQRKREELELEFKFAKRTLYQ
jgi:hypothetical protein